ncbi:hypothetical protein BC835DRAFT_1413141 [Cytidiella melzeri]|nr:hypothetical protein BC835DRAFT_1413141 [Cytidiella melzeri]
MSATHAFSKQTPWHNDGDIVLICADVGFRAHLTVLAAQSSIFRHMSEMPQPRQECLETYDGCPVVRLQDTVQDIKCFLEAIYELQSGLSQATLTFPCIGFASASSLLRLGTKYDAPLVRDLAISTFASVYPSTNDAWLKRDNIRQFPPFAGELRAILTLAIENDVDTLIPSILYTLSKLPPPEATSELLSLPIDPTTVQDLRRRYLTGTQALHRAETKALLSYISPSFAQPKCQGLRSAAICGAANSFKAPGSSGLCAVCCDLIEKSIQEGAEEIWRRVPEMFGFASWETLRARDRLSD